jgi:EmrB/QacA subfamily drug resistance transporter
MRASLMSTSTPTTNSYELSPKQIITAMSGLVIALLLAMLDNMIVAPALPTIVGDLGGLEHLAWGVTGYILASTVSTPIWGKLGDLFGHKRTFMIAITIFLVGSALCGMSQNMTELVGFRALQGLGAGGLMVGVMSVIGIMVSPRDRGKYQGIMMAVMPAAMIAGPLIGGYITDNASWRWVFYVNLPLGLFALVVIALTLNLPAEMHKKASALHIDWWGAGVLTVWISALVLLVTWGGTQYSWGSWQIVGLGVVAVVGFLVFVRIERRVDEPVMPLKMFSIANFSLASALGFVAGFAMFGGVTFLPQFQQFVQGQSATNSGLLLMPMMISAMVCSLAGGFIISRTGRYKVFPILGTAFLALGLWLFSRMGVDTTVVTTGVYMLALGAGMGFLMQTTNLIAQNSVPIRDLGTATGTATFTRNLGSSIGVALLGAIYANQLTSTLSGAAAGGPAPSASGMTPEALRQLPAAVQELFHQAVANGTQAIFLLATAIAAVGFVLSWFIKEVKLRDTVVPVDEAEKPTTSPEVLAQLP